MSADVKAEAGASRLTIGVLAFLVLTYAAASISAGSASTRGAFIALNMLAAFAVWLLWRRGDVGLRTVVVLALLFRLLYLWLPPVLSDDAFRYIWDGMLQMHGLNPFAYRPDDTQLAFLHGEAIYDELNSASYYTVYPPLSQIAFRIGGWFYDLGWQTSYYIIKGVLAACEIGALLILARVLPARQLMLYAWNPLVVLVVAGQAHTESIAVLCLVVAWIMARRRRGGWASVGLAAAGLVKLYPFVLLPLLWRRFGWRSVWPAALTCAVVGLPYYHPDAVTHVLTSLELYVRSFEFNAGVYYAVKEAFEIVTGDDWSKQIGPAFRWLFLASLPVVYVLDRRYDWTFRRAGVVILGLFFVFSTTIHPWYFLPLLAWVAAARPPSWHWYWVGIASIGTYLLYVGGPYWMWVVLGWTGWCILALWRYAEPVLDSVMHRRARQKAALLIPLLQKEHPKILDLGAAEGYVARELAAHITAEVTLADIQDMNRTNLPMVVYDGRQLPFEDDSFDVVALVYVLHHAADAHQLIAECHRVCRGQILVLESTYSNQLQRAMLSIVDRIANHLRSWGSMNDWKETLHFRTFEGWRQLFEANGLIVKDARELGGLIHQRALYVLTPEG